MPFMPFNVLGMWFRGLLALALLGAAAYLLAEWYQRREVVVTEPVATDARETDERPEEAGRREEIVVRTRVVRWRFGLNRETAFLLGGLALLGWSLGGGWLASPRSWRPA